MGIKLSKRTIIALIISTAVLWGCGSAIVSKELIGKTYTDNSDRTVVAGKLFVKNESDKKYYLIYKVIYSDGREKLIYEGVNKSLYDGYNKLKEENYQSE